MSGVHRFAVCRVLRDPAASSDGEENYEVRQLFAGETCSEVTDEMDGSRVTVFRRDGEVVDSAGELCGVYDDRGEARIQASRLNKLLDVMES